MKDEYGERAYSPSSLALRATSHRFQMTLKRLESCGMVAMDSEVLRKDKELQEMVHRMKRVGANLRGLTYQPTYSDKLENVLNTVVFCPSHMSGGIQLADMVAYIIDRNCRARYEQGWESIKPFFDKYGSKSEPSILYGER
jgi:hypothetical protein